MLELFERAHTADSRPIDAGHSSAFSSSFHSDRIRGATDESTGSRWLTIYAHAGRLVSVVHPARVAVGIIGRRGGAATGAVAYGDTKAERDAESVSTKKPSTHPASRVPAHETDALLTDDKPRRKRRVGERVNGEKRSAMSDRAARCRRPVGRCRPAQPQRRHEGRRDSLTSRAQGWYSLSASPRGQGCATLPETRYPTSWPGPVPADARLQPVSGAVDEPSVDQAGVHHRGGLVLDLRRDRIASRA